MDASVFGRPAPDSLASSIMGNATLNAVPSPDDPAGLVKDETLGPYLDALYACDGILATENSLERRLETERARAFFKSIIDAIEGQEGLEGAPAPPPPQSMMPQGDASGAPPAAGPPQGAPMGAPGGQPPGVSGAQAPAA